MCTFYSSKNICLYSWAWCLSNQSASSGAPEWVYILYFEDITDVWLGGLFVMNKLKYKKIFRSGKWK